MDIIQSSEQTKNLYRGTRLVWYIVGAIEIMLLFRFVLKFLSANPNAIFTSLLYGITGIFTAPFSSVFRASRADAAVWEWSTLLAMLIYWIIAWGVVKLLIITNKPVSTPEAIHKLEEEDK